MEKYKWLWEKWLTTEQRDDLVRTIVAEGDLVTLKWLWSEWLTTEQRDNLAEAIIIKGDLETLKWFWNKWLTDEQRTRLARAIAHAQDVANLDQKDSRALSELETKESEHFEYDFFICHASEDKESFARDLAMELKNNGFKVWYDEFTLTLGDSLRRKIDQGLAHSRYGIVILSTSFFEKEWPQRELDGFSQLERNGRKIILPVWHGVRREDVATYSPMLADRVAVSSAKGIDSVVKGIMEAVGR